MSVQSVPFLSIFGMALSLVISFGLPLAAFIYSRKKLDARISSLIFGALIYYIAAKVFEPFINASILSNVGGAMMNNIFVYAVYVGLIAAVVEEGCKYLCLKTIIKNVDLDNTRMFALGFVAAEAILTAAWPQLGNILNSVLINNGAMAETLKLMQEPMLSETYFALAPLWETSSLTFLLSGFERLFIMLMHANLCILLFFYIKKAEKKYLIAAFGAHFAVVACSALIGRFKLESAPLLSVAVTCAIVCAVTIFTGREYSAFNTAEAVCEE